MTEENKLSFSANGLGVVLRTKYGSLRFTTEEYSYYHNLFKIADSQNHGKLHINGIPLTTLLVRTDVIWSIVEKALDIVSKHRTPGDGESGDVLLYQWLMLCKLIAYYQGTKRTPSDKLFKNLHSSKIKIPLVDFHLGCVPSSSFAYGTYYTEFDVTLAEWQVSGDDFQNQHVKFRVESVARLVDNNNQNAANSDHMVSLRDVLGLSDPSNHKINNDNSNHSLKNTRTIAPESTSSMDNGSSFVIGGLTAMDNAANRRDGGFSNNDDNCSSGNHSSSNGRKKNKKGSAGKKSALLGKTASPSPPTTVSQFDAAADEQKDTIKGGEELRKKEVFGDMGVGLTSAAAESSSSSSSSTTTTTTNGMNSNPTVAVAVVPPYFSVERRYSEFEAFAQILRRNYRSIIVPPLPVKNWNFLSNAQSLANQRAREFQMFLDDLTSHPVLKHSYELQAFLQTSTIGYKSFLELYAHIHDGKVDYHSANQSINGVTKLISDGAAAVSTGAQLLVAQAHKMGYLNSIWDTWGAIQKNVALLPAAVAPAVIPTGIGSPIRPTTSSSSSSLEYAASDADADEASSPKPNSGKVEEREPDRAGKRGEGESSDRVQFHRANSQESDIVSINSIPPTTPSTTTAGLGGTSSEDALNLILERTKQTLTHIATVGHKLELIISQEHSYHTELAKIGQTCKYMVEFETIPELARVLSLASTGVSVHTRTQLRHLEHQHLEVQIPLQYMGRYGEAYQMVLAHRRKVADEKNQAYRSELSAQRTLEQMQIALSSRSNSNSFAAASSSSSGGSTSGGSGVENGINNNNTAAFGTVSDPSVVAHEQTLNQAKLDLAAAEDAYENKRAIADACDIAVRKEASRIDNLERDQLMICVKKLVISRAEAARQSVKMWEDMRAELSSNPTFNIPMSPP